MKAPDFNPKGYVPDFNPIFSHSQIIEERDIKNIKENDIFFFQWNSDCKIFEPNHCFDGKLIAKRNYKDELILQDTYWIDCNSCFTFGLLEAIRRGTLKYQCNLGDLEKPKRESADNYYLPEDIFNLSWQHGSYKRILVRKSAEFNKDVILKAIEAHINETESTIRFANNQISRWRADMEKINSGDLNVYL